MQEHDEMFISVRCSRLKGNTQPLLFTFHDFLKVFRGILSFIAISLGPNKGMDIL